LLSISLTGKEINEYLGAELNEQLNEILKESEKYNINENGLITDFNNQEIAKLLMNYKEILEKILKKILIENYNKIGDCVQIGVVNQYNDGYFWENIEEFKNDKDIVYSSEEMVNIYVDKMMNSDLKIFQIKSPSEMKTWFTNEWILDSKFILKETAILYIEDLELKLIEQEALFIQKKKHKNKENTLELKRD